MLNVLANMAIIIFRDNAFGKRAIICCWISNQEIHSLFQASLWLMTTLWFSVINILVFVGGSSLTGTGASHFKPLILLLYSNNTK
jgi:hypothetical protein